LEASNVIIQASGGYLSYGGSTTFYADAVPSGSTQETIYTTSDSAAVSFQWQSM
jgi:ribonuclease T2